MSFSRYAEYRESGIEWLGEVPAHWSICPVGTLFREVSDEGDDELPILSVSIHHGVSDRELADDELDRKVTRSEDLSKYKQVRPNDLVYNMMRAWQGGFGTVLVRGQVSPAYVVARPRAEIQSRYIEYLLRTPSAVEEMRRRSHGVTDFRLRLYWDEFKSMHLALPNAAEQAAILSFLDRETGKIDGLVAEQEKLIALLAEKRQAVISHVVTKGLDPIVPMKESGIEWLGEAPKHWVVCLLKRAFRSVEYGISDSLSPEGEIAVLRMGNIQQGRVVVADDLKFVDTVEPGLLLEEGDLLFNRTNSLDLIGKVGAYRQGTCDPVTFASYLVRLRTQQGISPSFFSYLLNTPAILGEARSMAFVAIGQCNLNPTRYGQLLIAIPPADEQAQISAFLDHETSQFDALTTEARRAIDLLREHRTALIFAAVTGKIDVRELVEMEAA